MREVIAFLTCSVGIIGCAHATASNEPRFSALLANEREPLDARGKIAFPSGDCLARARQYVGDDSELIRLPLPRDMRERVERILDGLHPVAKKVLARTAGIGFAQNIPDAAAVFLPCDI